MGETQIDKKPCLYLPSLYEHKDVVSNTRNELKQKKEMLNYDLLKYIMIANATALYTEGCNSSGQWELKS